VVPCLMSRGSSLTKHVRDHSVTLSLLNRSRWCGLLVDERFGPNANGESALKMLLKNVVLKNSKSLIVRVVAKTRVGVESVDDR